MPMPRTMAEVEAHNARVAAGRKSPVPAVGNSAAVQKTTIAPTAGTGFLKLVISGQVRGGKNNMIVTRQGRHFPKPEWARWRDITVASIRAQLPAGWVAIAEPCLMRLDYFAGDKRRRDMPAIVDSIFHCLEKAVVVSDDTLVWVNHSSRSYDKENPRAEITISDFQT